MSDEALHRLELLACQCHQLLGCFALLLLVLRSHYLGSYRVISTYVITDTWFRCWFCTNVSARAADFCACVLKGWQPHRNSRRNLIAPRHPRPARRSHPQFGGWSAVDQTHTATSRARRPQLAATRRRRLSNLVAGKVDEEAGELRFQLPARRRGGGRAEVPAATYASESGSASVTPKRTAAARAPRDTR